MLVTMRGASQFEALWNGAVELKIDRNLRQKWGAALRVAATTAGATMRRRGALRRKASLGAPFHHGVALLDARGDGISDYLGRGIEESLLRAAEFGADAYTLTVFGSPRLWASDLPGSADRLFCGSSSDLALAHAVAVGRSANMRPGLVVEPLAACTGTRADAAIVPREEDWERFFEGFEDLAVHYGLLAELVLCEFLCLGTDLEKAARTAVADPDEVDAAFCRQRLEAWKALIERTRACYTGPLTYGAENSTEASQVDFWPELDYVGLLVFPLRIGEEGKTPTDHQIRSSYRRQLQRATELGRSCRRPVLVLQTGFPSASDSWQGTWIPRGEPDPQAQSRVLGFLAEALDNNGRGHEGIQGLYLWSWFADPTLGGSEDRGFTPQNKEAEEVLPRLFSAPTRRQ